METRAELPFTGDQIGLFRAQPGRPTLSALQFGAIHPHEFFPMHVLPKSFHRSACMLMTSITYNAVPQNRSNCFLKPAIAIITRKGPGIRAQSGGPHARRRNGHVHGSIELQALVLPVRHPQRQRAIQKARPDLGIGHAVMLPDSNRSSIWIGELEPTIGLKARNACSVAIGQRVSECWL